MAGTDLGGFEKVLRVGEGRRLKRLRSRPPTSRRSSPSSRSSPTTSCGQDGRVPAAARERRGARGPPLRGVRRRPRGASSGRSDQRLFDVQLMGGIVLHEGDIAEMKTGEGKTFVATTAALPERARRAPDVHLVTVNDYLAKRDAEWTGPVYERARDDASAAIENMMPFAERKAAYAADITYGTNSEFGFDYLRDNMAVSLEGCVQRGHAYAIVDEVDSILIDEARTPLIISGEPETAAQVYYDFARIVKGADGESQRAEGDRQGRRGPSPGADYLYDEKFKTVSPARVGDREGRARARGSTTSTTRGTSSSSTT